MIKIISYSRITQNGAKLQSRRQHGSADLLLRQLGSDPFFKQGAAMPYHSEAFAKFNTAACRGGFYACPKIQYIEKCTISQNQSTRAGVKPAPTTGFWPFLVFLQRFHSVPNDYNPIPYQTNGTTMRSGR
ncbi:hypothetical protein D0T90_04735 [Neisseria animalis]|uniref:Uncharacterized protein n=1 Tax=Neisseria animalis TaxID=492 RepID=A0A5P3MQM5_NEIAN|nr:hypothetical protein D0T90_04735 [Neisseria animalis]ROW32039.1 hypothetical protein CGZ60_06800 [Neisseria animalis]